MNRVELVLRKRIGHVVVVTVVKHLFGLFFVPKTLMVRKVTVLTDVQIFVIKDIPV